MMNDVLPKTAPSTHEEIGYRLDLSWFCVAVDRFGGGWVLNASEGFYETDLFLEMSTEDNGVNQPDGLAPGLYIVTSVRIYGGNHPDMNGEYDDTEISGTWTLLANAKSDTPKP